MLSRRAHAQKNGDARLQPVADVSFLVTLNLFQLARGTELHGRRGGAAAIAERYQIKSLAILSPVASPRPPVQNMVALSPGMHGMAE